MCLVETESNKWNGRMKRTNECCGCLRWCKEISATADCLAKWGKELAFWFECLLTHAPWVANNATSIRRSGIVSQQVKYRLRPAQKYAFFWYDHLDNHLGLAFKKAHWKSWVCQKGPRLWYFVTVCLMHKPCKEFIGYDWIFLREVVILLLEF